ncbi:MAG: hypothetical protein ABW034_13135 [Steroidobacteraceae bacterium]
MNFESITSDVTPLDPKDDGRHVLRDEPLCRESLVFTVDVPDEKIAGFVYPRVGSDGKAAGIVTVFGEGVPGGSITEVYHDIPVPASMDFGAWNAGGVEVRLTRPLRTAEVKYTSRRLGYEFVFEASHPAYSYDSHTDGCPRYFADNRFEQSGRVRGTLTIDGRLIELDTFGQRDHSWGTRNWGVNYHYKWFHATAPNAAVHFFKMEYLGRSLVRGYVFKKGHMSQVQSAEVLDFTLDDDMFHKDITARVYDAAGRATSVAGRGFAHTTLPVDANNVLHETPMTIEIDGESGLGWCEMHWDTRYLEHMRKFTHIRR